MATQADVKIGIDDSSLNNTNTNQNQGYTNMSGGQGAGYSDAGHATDCEKCLRIEAQCEEQVRASERLRQNNEDLKVKIEQLSQILNEKLEAFKQQRKAPVRREKSNDPVKKELDLLHKKLFLSQKQVKSLEEKQNNNQNVLRITEMKNDIADKQIQLQKIQKENKLLEDIKIQNQIILAERESAQEIKDLEEEAFGLKKLLKDVRANDRIVEKEMTKQCQYLVALEQKHKEVCQKFGISPSLNQSRFDNLQDIISENHKNRQIKQEKDERERVKKLGNLEVSETAYKQLLDDFRAKKQEKQELEATQKRELEELQAKEKQATTERDTLMLRMRDKEKELNIAIMKINELKRITKHNALQPLGLESVKGGIKGDNASAIMGALASKRKKDVRREQKGISVGSETACSWDNSSELPEARDQIITAITLWYKDEQIKGLTVEYKLKNGSKTILECFAPASTEGLEERSLKLRAPETIASITGYYNNFFIEYIRIISSRGNYVMAGSDKNQKFCKKFEFDIKKEERPIAFFGVVDRISIKKAKDTENTTETTDMILTSFGVEIKKREPNNASRLGGQITPLEQQQQQEELENNELYAENGRKGQFKSKVNNDLFGESAIKAGPQIQPENAGPHLGSESQENKIENESKLHESEVHHNDENKTNNQSLNQLDNNENNHNNLNNINNVNHNEDNNNNQPHQN